MASSSNNSQQPCSESADDDSPLLDDRSLEELLRLWADINGLSHDSHQQNHEQFVGAPPSNDPNTALSIVPNHTASNDMATGVNQNGPINVDEEEVINVEDYLIDTLDDYYDQSSSASPLAIMPPTPPELSGGDNTEKLEIHGRVGLISHVVHETKYRVNDLEPLVVEHKKIDFSPQSLEDVSQFLMNYCQERAEAGYIMVEDPLLTFYSALCAGANWDQQHITNIDDHQSVQPNSSAETVVDQLSQEVPEQSSTRLFKSSLAMQRERIRKLKLSDLEAYFHLPIEVAGKKLAICPTVLKKVKSVDRKILNLRVILRKKNGEEDAFVRAKIETLKQEREQIINGMMAK
ncbi:hypothetical protein Sjap_019732 [Stephania japonica]|uniref:RWP-RK domain-containing protein n=1 Tax=Stephania japonica TaxID=461633 RepID=A0AAP0HUZ9_9MAGN